MLSDESVDVAGSAHLVMRLVENLVTNACRAARAIVRVTVREETGFGVLVVDDDGTGIPIDQRETVFRRFFRAEVNSDGSGLGLSNAAAIATSLGGTIALDERLSGGALFRVKLPIAVDRSPEEPAQSSHA